MFKRLRKIGIVTLFAALFLVACSGNETTKEDTSDKLQVVATFSILHDIATQVGRRTLSMCTVWCQSERLPMNMSPCRKM